MNLTGAAPSNASHNNAWGLMLLYRPRTVFFRSELVFLATRNTDMEHGSIAFDAEALALESLTAPSASLDSRGHSAEGEALHALPSQSR